MFEPLMVPYHHLTAVQAYWPPGWAHWMHYYYNMKQLQISVLLQCSVLLQRLQQCSTQAQGCAWEYLSDTPMYLLRSA